MKNRNNTLEWKDITSYSRSDTKCEPTTFSAMCGPLRLVVTKGRIYYPSRWVAHAFPIFDTKPLDAETLEQAQDKVVALVREWLESAMAGLPNTKLTGDESSEAGG